MTSQAPALTAVVTAHTEGRLLRPTLRSVENALRAVIEAGDAAELLILCDNPDAATLAEAGRWRDRTDLPFTVRVETVDVGESGAARNAGSALAGGEYIAFIDGDDLISEEYLASAIRILRETSEPTVLHPEYVISFGARSLAWKVDSASSPEVTYRNLVRHNLWPASSVAHASTYRTVQYRSLAAATGYGPEDWTWNIDTVIAGFRHDIVPDSVFFYRARERGGVNNRHSGSILPPFDLAALRQALPLHESGPAIDTEDHRGWRDRARAFPRRLYSIALPAVRIGTIWMSFEVKHLIYRSVRWPYRVLTGWRQPVEPEPEPTSPAIQTALLAACELEPAISWTAFSFRTIPRWHARDDGYSEALENALDRIGDRGGAIVAVPWVGVGGADIVSLNYAKALEATERFRGRTSFLGTFDFARTRHELIPGSLNYVHLVPEWMRLSPTLRRRLIAQLVVMIRPELIVSVNCFHMTEALLDHAAPMTDGTSIYATLFAFDRIAEGYPVNPITDDGQRAYLDDIDGLLTDNTTTRALIEDILALPPGKAIVQRQPAMDHTPELPRATRAYNNEYFSPRNPFRLLWPHRLDEEKRPDTLAALSTELRERGVPAVIEVWGSRVLTEDGDSLMADLEAAGVVYRGPYTGGLMSLDTYDYHALLLTSKSEGLPLVLVQSLLRGLPVIASNVGGVPDIIVDDVTGIMTEGPDDISGFADAVERLAGDLELRRRIIENGYAFAVANHSWKTFATTVRETFAP